MFKTRRQKNMTIILAIIYMLLLIWLVLFKFQIGFSELSHMRSINFIPFRESMVVNGHIDLSEIIDNIIIFVPLGIYTSMYKSSWTFVKRIIPSFGVSFLFEVIQYIFAIGASDITDIIGNTLGGIVGIGIYELFYRIFKEKTINIINIIAAIITILSVSVLILLYTANM